jgi:hypothetical protein
MKKKPTWILLAACVGVVACDAALTEPLSALGQALEAEDAATSDDATTDDATTDDANDGSVADGDCDGPGGRRARGIAPPDGFDDVEVEACALPLEEGVDAGRRPHHRGHLAPLYDEDESHDLSEEEAAALAADVAAGCAARGATLLASWDADGSGALSQTEWDAARAALRAAHEAERADLDTDGDGRLSPAEREAAHEAAHDALIATWDLDDSGDLDETERAAMREDLQALVRAGERLPPLPPPPGGRHGHHGPPPPPTDDASSDDDGATE